MQLHFYITLLLLGLLILTVNIVVGCRDQSTVEKGMREIMPTRYIDKVKEAYTEELMELPGVVGVYVGELDNGTPCIGVMVEKLTPELEKKIPKTIEGHPVRIDETGEIKPLK